MSKQLEGMKVAILATDGFELVELTKPREALDQAGAQTEIVAPKEGSIRAWDETDWGDRFSVDRTLDDARPGDYDALLLPGGVLNPDNLRVNERALAFTRAFFDAGRPVAAICHGPWTLINAGVVEGRQMTSYHTIRKDLENAGARWVDESVVEDRGLVTSRNPDDLPDFCEAIVRVFAGSRRETAAT